MTMSEIMVSILVLLATTFLVINAIGIWRAPDALTRANLLGLTVSVSFPLIIAAKLINDWATQGFSLNNAIRALVAIAGVWVVSAVGSYYLGRTLYEVMVTDTGDYSNDLGQ